MATLEQNIEKIRLILEDIGKAINEMYLEGGENPPIILEGDCLTTPSEYANYIRNIPTNIELDPSMFSARIEIVE